MSKITYIPFSFEATQQEGPVYTKEGGWAVLRLRAWYMGSCIADESITVNGRWIWRPWDGWRFWEWPISFEQRVARAERRLLRKAERIIQLRKRVEAAA